MYLKKIEIFGFKSFALKTEVVFERGVTCIVGPNGCGKSNISDSIRWVLGERSAKMLRGSKMEDILFNGTDFRAPLNLAEVSLTIDNTDQKLPVQYQDVVLTRRLYRSGESEYLINKTPCRLKDIQDVILDTGIGSNSYCMIEQGKIDYILNAEAGERRFLIEEAAGISKYKVKKEEAIRKLERTEQNLLRLNDIVSEVERNIRYAERQAKRASRYKEQFEHLKNLEMKKAVYELTHQDQIAKNIETEKNNLAGQLQQLEESAARQNDQLITLESRLHELEHLFFEQETIRSQAKESLVALEGDENLKRQQIENLKLTAEKSLGESESLANRLDIIREEKRKRVDELDGLAQEKAGLESTRSEKEDSVQKACERYRLIENDIHEKQGILFDLAKQISDLKNNISQSTLEAHGLNRQLQNLEQTKKKLIAELDQLSERQHVVSEMIGGYQNGNIQTLTDLNEIKRQEAEAQAEWEKTQEELSHLSHEQMHVKGQIETLEELNQNGPELSAALLQDYKHQMGESALGELIAGIIDVEPGYEQALSAVLKQFSRSVVVDHPEDARKLIHWLKSAGKEIRSLHVLVQSPNSDDATFSAPDSIAAYTEKRLIDVLRVAEKYRTFIHGLLGDVWVVTDDAFDQIIQSISLPFAETIVTPSGNILQQSEIVFQISQNPVDHVWGIKKSLRDLNDRSVILTGETEILRQKQDGLRSRVSHLRATIEMQSQKNADLRLSHERMEATRDELAEQITKIQDELKIIQQEEVQISEEIGKIGQAKQLDETALQDLESREEQAKSFLHELQTRISQERSEREKIEKELAHITAKFDLYLDKERDLNHAIEFVDGQIADMESRIIELTHDRENALVRAEKLSLELSGYGEKKSSLQQEIINRSMDVERARKDRDLVGQTKDKLLAELKERTQAINDLKEKVHEYMLKSMQLDHEKNTIIQNLQTRYKISLTGINESEYAIDTEEYERIAPEIEGLREKIDQMGAINLLAIDEYDELKTRYDFMAKQKQDLEQARNELMEAIRKINRTTKSLFEETFQKVRESFQEYYKVLFRGGYADIILLDETNPLESGLDIVARPPGKKLQNITLLSGGEKALTALALLFALFSVKPSPFCVLDEVDAPLDEANTDRFLSVLRLFLNTTQFIIVTHCRKTIAMGDSLYGVTMEEPGVSKLVSVKLSSDQSNKKIIEHEDGKVVEELNKILT